MNILELYIKNLDTESLPDFSQRKKISTETLISYLKVHLELSVKYKSNDHLYYFLNLLQTKRIDLGLKLDDIYSIFHNTGNCKTSSCLDYANQNKDKNVSKSILHSESILHCNDQSALKSCIRENLVNDEIKEWLKEQCEENIDKDFLKDTFGINKHGQSWIIFSLMLESVVFSILPYLWDQVSDFRLYQTYSSMSNESWFGNLTAPNSGNTAFEYEDTYSPAALITKWILIVNALIYLLGSTLSSPDWIHAMYDENKQKLEKRSMYSPDMIEFYKKEQYQEFKELSNEYLETKKFCILLLIPIARLLWPLLILVPHQFINLTSKLPSKESKAKYKSENLWLFIKIVESSIENVLQTALQLWVLFPIFGLISQWSLSELMLSGSKGALNIMSFGIYKPETIDMVIGKIMFTVILLSFSHSWMKLKKQGLGLLAKLKSLPIVFLSTLLQVTSRIFVLGNLMIMDVSAVKKYTLFLLVHFLSLLVIKILFETRKKQKLKNTRNILKTLYYYMKRPVLLVVSCLSSTLVMADLHWISSKLHYPKHNFVSQCLFFLLIFVENLMMTLLPFLVPSLFPSKSEFNHNSFIYALVFVNVSWIGSVILEVIGIKLYFFLFLSCLYSYLIKTCVKTNIMKAYIFHDMKHDHIKGHIRSLL